MKLLSIFLSLFILIPWIEIDEQKKIQDIQPPIIEWNRTYGGRGMDIFYCGCVSNDGGFVACGNREIDDVNYAWILKVNENGEKEWEVLNMPNNLTSFVSCIQVTKDGYIACGSYMEGITHLRYYRFLWKINLQGKTEWFKTYDMPQEGHFYMVYETADGYIVVGYIYINVTQGDTDAILMKTDKNGNVEWQKIYRYGNGSEEIYCLSFASNGYIMGGWAETEENNLDFWIIKADEEGNVKWKKTFGGDKLDICHSRNCFQSQNSYIFGGHTFSYGAGYGDIWIIKVSEDGEMIWNETFGYRKTKEMMWGMDKCNGSYILAGAKNCEGIMDRKGDAWIIKIDERGNVKWSEIIGGKEEDQAVYVCRVGDDGYIVIGRTKSFGAGDWDGWMIKISADKELSNPSIELKKPKNGYIYFFDLFDIPLPFLDKAVIFGDITFEVIVSDENTGIVKVEYFINNKLIAEITEPPFSFKWNEFDAGKYNLKARAYNSFGGTSQSDAKLQKIL